MVMVVMEEPGGTSRTESGRCDGTCCRCGRSGPGREVGFVYFMVAFVVVVAIVVQMTAE